MDELPFDTWMDEQDALEPIGFETQPTKLEKLVAWIKAHWFEAITLLVSTVLGILAL